MIVKVDTKNLEMKHRSIAFSLFRVIQQTQIFALKKVPGRYGNSNT